MNLSSAMVLAVVVLCQTACRMPWGTGTRLATRLSDQEFWRLTTTLSEPAGVFEHSDNLVSNELRYVHTIRLLRPSGGVYIGVGPEQNFSYIARLRPKMAFIIDVRNENRNLHFMYKALFELSGDRADFLSRLFSRPRPPGVGAQTSVADLFAHYDQVAPVSGVYEANLQSIRRHLSDTHRFSLSTADFEWIEAVFKAFYSDGLDINYGRSLANDSPRPTYRTLMTAADLGGHARSFLATEEDFAFVKELHVSNLIVPIVGNFSGPNAMRLVGEYVGQHAAVVRAFYASNVEVYLNRQQTVAFCRNLASLPADSRSWFIGSKGMQPFLAKLGSCSAAR